MDKIWGYC